MLPFSIVNMTGRGRCMIANKDFRKGELIVEEQPFAMVISQAYADVSCGFCGMTCIGGTVYALSSEDTVKYCSEACITNDYPVHSLEVDALRLLKNFRTSSINIDSLRLILRCGAVRKAVPSVVDGTSSETGENAVQSSTFADIIALESIASGLSEEENNDIDVLIDKLSKICMIRKLPLSQAEIRSILFSIQCNAHRIINKESQHVALGLFPLISMINHSCVPNCTHYFELSESGEKPKMIIRAISDISAGDEIVYSYVPLYQSTKSRREQLFNAYSFHCNCVKCSETPSDSVTDWEIEYPGDSREDRHLAPLKQYLSEYVQEVTEMEDLSPAFTDDILSKFMSALHNLLDTPVDASVEINAECEKKNKTPVFVTNKHLLHTYVAVSKLAASSDDVATRDNGESVAVKQRLNTSLLFGLLALGCIYKHVQSIEIEAIQIVLQLVKVCEKLAATAKGVDKAVETVFSSVPAAAAAATAACACASTNADAMCDNWADKLLDAKTLFSVSSTYGGANGDGGDDDESCAMDSTLRAEWKELLVVSLGAILSSTPTSTTPDVVVSKDAGIVSGDEDKGEMHSVLALALQAHADDQHLICRGSKVATAMATK